MQSATLSDTSHTDYLTVQKKLITLCQQKEVDLDIHWLTGAFTAALCAPKTLSFSETMANLFDIDAEAPEDEEDLALESTFEAFFCLLQTTLEAGSYPYLSMIRAENPSGAIEWASGFLTVIDWHAKAWVKLVERLPEHEEYDYSPLVGILALAEMNEKSTHEISEFLKQLTQPDTIQSTLQWCTLAITQLYPLAKNQREQPVMASTEKSGRNHLCRCGSGKKYKKCCGLTPHRH
jgi:uncharacterized protein